MEPAFGAARYASREWPARSVLAELPIELRTAFLRLGRLRCYARDEVIIAENATSTNVYVILSGFVRVLNHASSGDVTVIALRTVGELVGELAAMDGRPRASTVIAANRIFAMTIDARLFRSFIADNPMAGEVIMRSVVSKLRTATRYRVETGRASILTRVARVLDHLGEGHGRAVASGLLIDVPLPQRDLAALVGTSEKSISRAYARLEHEGVIEVSYRRIVILDLQLLRQHAHDMG
jgi:CRP-like cAMP-binding protein